MKRKILLALLTLMATSAFSMGLAACAENDQGDDKIEWGETYTISAAYDKAQDLGYTGSLDEFIEAISGEDGQDGVGITDAEINDEGNLIIFLSDGSEINLGNIKGSQGEDGQDGTTIVGAFIDNKGNLILSLSDQTTIDCGHVVGADGQNGTNGQDGLGIKQVYIDREGKLVIVYTDDTSSVLDKVIGSDGKDGVGIKDIGIDDNGNLVITLTNDTKLNLGNIYGQDGSDGKDGVGIKDIGIDDNRNLVVTLTNGNQFNLGNIDGQDGNGISSVFVNEKGELIIILTSGSEYNLGNISGKDGCSAYEIYLKYHPQYSGSEEDWMNDLISGKLELMDYSSIEYIPEMNYTFAAGQNIVLPDELYVYFTDGSVQIYSVLWESIPSSSFIGMKKAYGIVEELGLDVSCNVQISNYSSNDSYINGFVNGILGQDEVLVTIYNDTYIDTIKVESDGYFCFDGLNEGVYYIKVDAPGYKVCTPQKVELSSVTADPASMYKNIGHVYFTIEASRIPGYYFVWNRTEDTGNTETEAHVNAEISIDFLDDYKYASNSGDASYLRDKYNVVLLDDEAPWSTETSSRFLELYESLPSEVTNEIKSVWTLTRKHLQNDISFTLKEGVYYVTVSIDAVENMTPRVAVADGVTGKYFSNRFYNALVRFVTDNGTDAEKCERILNENFATSFNVPDYSALTAGITNEDASQFQEFLPEEKLLILTMFEEMPTGMHKMPELKYLVRRKTGQSHPLYPSAAAVTWTTAEQPYIEFMDSTFDGSSGYYNTKRLIIHEKTHMYWQYYFSDALKAKWCEIGGWYRNGNDADGWSTTKQTEFVSAYAHAHNPDEDMAESVATYVIDPALLMSRSPSKYEFIKQYIMGGSFYLTQIRDDLTFEVYNFNPDYTYPGQIDSIEINVEGGLFEDKSVTFNVTLYGTEEYEGAESIYFRLYAGDETVNQFYDVRLHKTDDSGLVFTDTIVISKYSYKGYWYTDQIEIIDAAGNERYESNSDFSFKVYIDNPMCDSIRPELARGSLELSLENAQNDVHPDAQYLIVKFNFVENVYLDKALVRLYCMGKDGDSIDTYAEEDEIYQEAGEVIMRIFIPEHYSCGIYEISEISLTDLAGNNNFYHIDYGTLVEENNKIEIITTNPDDKVPVLDINDIQLSAVPSIPEQPNGETYVTITLKVNDDISGIKIGYLRLVDPQGVQHGYWLYFPNYSGYYFEGSDPTEVREYTFTVTLPKGSVPGMWGVYEISLTDYALNVGVYDFTEIVHFEVC